MVIEKKGCRENNKGGMTTSSLMEKALIIHGLCYIYFF